MHTHDWATAPVAFAGDLAGARSVFTIHNLNYGADLIGRAMAASRGVHHRVAHLRGRGKPCVTL